MEARHVVPDTAVGSIGVKPPFGMVVEQHRPTVFRVCRVMLTRHDADDARAETFLAALRAYQDLPADANLQAWPVTIAHHKAIDVWRATKRLPMPVAAVPDDRATTAIPGAGDPDLWPAVGRLPERQRLAVAYCYAAGLSYSEIAEIVGGTVDAARRAAADGLKNLRKHYSDAEAEGATS